MALLVFQTRVILALSLYVPDYFQLDPSGPHYGGMVETKETILLPWKQLDYNHIINITVDIG